MGEVWREHPSFELVEQASEVTGRDVARLLLAADQETLTRTDNSQLATFVLSLVVLDAAERVGLEPGALAGHSLGEYSALVASGALDFEDGLRLVAERGSAMQQASEDSPGTMAAVLGLEDDAVESACGLAEGDVWVANYNAPGQVVIAGTHDAVAEAGRIAKDLGGRRVLPLPVGGAFHTPLMSPARDRLRKALAEVAFRAPEPAVVANVDARHHDGADEWHRLLSAQLCSPVRWRQSLDTLFESAANTLVEIGPGNVLTGLARRVLPGDAVAVSVSTPDDLDRLIEMLAGHSPAVQAAAEARTGERFHIFERLVLSPAAGLFEPDPSVTSLIPGAGRGTRQPVTVEVGGLIGLVGSTEVRSAFEGSLEGVLVLPGERVTTGQPVAWLRAAASEAAAK